MDAVERPEDSSPAPVGESDALGSRAVGRGTTPPPRPGTLPGGVPIPRADVGDDRVFLDPADPTASLAGATDEPAGDDPGNSRVLD